MFERGKGINITDGGGLQSCEILWIPLCLDSLLKDGGTVGSLMHRPRSTPPEYYFSASGTHFCKRLSELRGLRRLEGLGKLQKINSLHQVSNPRPSGL
jgi:hypothetical protein